MLPFSLGGKSCSFRKPWQSVTDMKDDPLSFDNPRKVILVVTSVRIFCMDYDRLFMCCQNPLGKKKKKKKISVKVNGNILTEYLT